MWDFDVDAIICVTCLPNLTAPKKYPPKNSPKKNTKICAACGGKGHWRSNYLSFPKNKQNLEASEFSKGDVQTRTTNNTRSTRKAIMVTKAGKDTCVPKTNYQGGNKSLQSFPGC